MTVLLVAAGGLIGVLARYGLGTTVCADNQPWMIFAINVAGSFLLGAVLPWSDTAIFDLKTGDARLTAARIVEIQRHVPRNMRNVPIEELRIG